MDKEKPIEEKLNEEKPSEEKPVEKKPTEKKPVEETSVKKKSKRTYSILAVDDSAFFLQQIKGYLMDTKYEVTCVNSGKSALKYLLTNQPDLFILDIHMPEMDGYDLARAIKAKGMEQPIIFLTSHASKVAVVNTMEAGGSDFIVKPCTKELLIERIAKHLR